jgi:hypothetical protein
VHSAFGALPGARLMVRLAYPPMAEQRPALTVGQFCLLQLGQAAMPVCVCGHSFQLFHESLNRVFSAIPSCDCRSTFCAATNRVE